MEVHYHVAPAFTAPAAGSGDVVARSGRARCEPPHVRPRRAALRPHVACFAGFRPIGDRASWPAIGAQTRAASEFEVVAHSLLPSSCRMAYPGYPVQLRPTWRLSVKGRRERRLRPLSLVAPPRAVGAAACTRWATHSSEPTPVGGGGTRSFETSGVVLTGTTRRASRARGHHCGASAACACWSSCGCALRFM